MYVVYQPVGTVSTNPDYYSNPYLQPALTPRRESFSQVPPSPQGLSPPYPYAFTPPQTPLPPSYQAPTPTGGYVYPPQTYPQSLSYYPTPPPTPPAAGPPVFPPYGYPPQGIPPPPAPPGPPFETGPNLSRGLSRLSMEIASQAGIEKLGFGELANAPEAIKRSFIQRFLGPMLFLLIVLYALICLAWNNHGMYEFIKEKKIIGIVAGVLSFGIGACVTFFTRKIIQSTDHFVWKVLLFAIFITGITYFLIFLSVITGRYHLSLVLTSLGMVYVLSVLIATCCAYSVDYTCLFCTSLVSIIATLVGWAIYLKGVDLALGVCAISAVLWCLWANTMIFWIGEGKRFALNLDDTLYALIIFYSTGFSLFLSVFYFMALMLHCVEEPGSNKNSNMFKSKKLFQQKIDH